MIGLRGVAHAAQSLNDVGLRIGLARVNDVVDGLRAAKVRMLGGTVYRREPALAVGVGEEGEIAEVLAKEAELPEVIGDVFADVRDGAVGADDDLGILVGAALRAVLVLVG